MTHGLILPSPPDPLAGAGKLRCALKALLKLAGIWLLVYLLFMVVYTMTGGLLGEKPVAIALII